MKTERSPATSAGVTSPPLKWHGDGGKTYLAKKIIELMPPRVKNPNAPAADDPGWVHYVEPFFGGGAVLLAQDPEGISEVVNDLNGELTNFWQCLQCERSFERLKRRLESTPCSQFEFNRSKNPIRFEDKYDVGMAAAFFIRNRQSRQALGKDFATLARTRTRRGMNELPSAWLSAIDGLPEVHARLQRVVILNDDALAVIKQQDDTRTLFYLDPPYVHETRSATKAYKHEMNNEKHESLLQTLGTIKGRFMLSGYSNPMYQVYADRYGWRRVDFEIDNKSGGGKKKQMRTESVWMNY